MKKLIFLFVLFLFASCTQSYYPFAGVTKNKPIKRLTYQQHRSLYMGGKLYTRCNGRQHKATMKIIQYNKQHSPWTR